MQDRSSPRNVIDVEINPTKMDSKDALLLHVLNRQYPNGLETHDSNQLKIHYRVTLPQQTYNITLTHALTWRIYCFKPEEADHAPLLTSLINEYLKPGQDYLYADALYSLPIPGTSSYMFYQVAFHLARYHPKKLAVIDPTHFAHGGMSTVHHQVGRVVLNTESGVYEYKLKKTKNVMKIILRKYDLNTAINIVNNEYELTKRLPSFHVKGPCHDSVTPFSGFIMRYIAGDELFDLMQAASGAPIFTLSQLLMFCKMLCEELVYLHETNIIHRDLKPENIKVLRDKNGNIIKVFIFDIGLAKDKHRNDANERPGTLMYLAKETLELKGQTEKSDMVAFGRVIQPFFGSYYLMRLSQHFPQALLTNANLFDREVIPELFKKPYTTDCKTLSEPEEVLTGRFLVSCEKSDPDLRPTARQALDLFSNLFRQNQSPRAMAASIPLDDTSPRKRKLA